MRVFLSLFFCAGILAAGPSFCDPSPGWQLEWADEFDGPDIDTSRWTVTTGKGPASDAQVRPMPHGFGSGNRRVLDSPRADCQGKGCIPLGSCRMAVCTEDNVYISNGSLILESKRENLEDRNYSTGAVHSYDKSTWNTAQGAFRMCVSARLPGGNGGNDGVGQGIWPAHWLMPNDDSCDPDEGEIDILEMVNGDGLSESTYHWQTAGKCKYPANHKSFTTNKPLPKWDTEFHEYAIEHGSSYLAFVYDGEVLVNKSSAQDPSLLFWLVDRYLIMNTAIGGGWPGPPDATTTFPTYHAIDYVRVARQQNNTATDKKFQFI